MSRDRDDVRIQEALCVKETEKAILVQHEDLPDCQMWFPKSVVTDDSEVYKTGDQGTLVIAGWFAEKNGLG